MSPLAEQFQLLQGRVCLIGIGNADGGDDALGVHLAEHLRQAGVGDVLIAGNRPETLLTGSLSDAFDHILFVDAVDFRGKPGSAVLLNSQQMTARFPQVSTHQLSLGLLARLAEANGVTRAWLLGVQPESLEANQPLSASVHAAMLALAELLMRHLHAGANA